MRRVRVSARGSRREGGCIRISGKRPLGDSGRPEKHHGGARRTPRGQTSVSQRPRAQSHTLSCKFVGQRFAWSRVPPPRNPLVPVLGPRGGLGWPQGATGAPNPPSASATDVKFDRQGPAIECRTKSRNERPNLPRATPSSTEHGCVDQAGSGAWWRRGKGRTRLRHNCEDRANYLKLLTPTGLSGGRRVVAGVGVCIGERWRTGNCLKE